MKNKYIILFLSFIAIILMSSNAMGAITQADNSIAEGATNVSTEVGTFTILLNSSIGDYITVNLSLYQATTLVTYSYLTDESNGTKSLTIPSLTGNTAYQVRVNANDSEGYNNATYNFTTGTKKLTDQTENFGSAEILLLGLVALVIVLGFVISLAYDIKKHKKLDANLIIKKVVLVIMFVVAITIIASLI